MSNAIVESKNWVNVLQTALEKEEDQSYKIGNSNLNKRGLYSILFKRLKEVQFSVKKEIIPFTDVFAKICRTFSITKKECWDILFLTRDMGAIEIVPFHGIKIVSP